MNPKEPAVAVLPVGTKAEEEFGDKGDGVIPPCDALEFVLRGLQGKNGRAEEPEATADVRGEGVFGSAEKLGRLLGARLEAGEQLPDAGKPGCEFLRGGVQGRGFPVVGEDQFPAAIHEPPVNGGVEIAGVSDRERSIGPLGLGGEEGGNSGTEPAPAHHDPGKAVGKFAVNSGAGAEPEPTEARFSVEEVGESFHLAPDPVAHGMESQDAQIEVFVVLRERLVAGLAGKAGRERAGIQHEALLIVCSGGWPGSVRFRGLVS
jgi:hypothetical protein